MAKVRVTGPLFDNRGRAITAQFCRELEGAVAANGVRIVHAVLDSSLKTQTPYYNTMIRTDRVAEGMSINDDNVVYGPWLEGVSERNQTTRFRGYHAFRRSTQMLQRQVKIIAARMVDTYVRKLDL